MTSDRSSVILRNASFGRVMFVSVVGRRLEHIRVPFPAKQGKTTRRVHVLGDHPNGLIHVRDLRTIAYHAEDRNRHTHLLRIESLLVRVANL